MNGQAVIVADIGTGVTGAGERNGEDTGPDGVVGAASTGGGGGEDGAEPGDRIFRKGSHLGHEDVRGGTVGTKESGRMGRRTVGWTHRGVCGR